MEMIFCVCGSTIHKTKLPTELAKLSGKKTLWIHTDSRDTRCYPDEDETCHAEPEGTRG